MNYAQQHLRETAEILRMLDVAAIERARGTLGADKSIGRPGLFPRRGRQRRQLLARRE